jgi:L-fucose mutarotase
MLKNLDPILTGALLSILDEMEPGEWLTVTAGPVKTPGLNEGHTVVDLSDTSVEAATQALLSVLPLDTAEAPIAYLDDLDAQQELPDVVFAVCGIAADAELRRVPMSRLDEHDFRAIAVDATATIRTDRFGESAAFLLRKGELVAA